MFVSISSGFISATGKYQELVVLLAY